MNETLQAILLALAISTVVVLSGLWVIHSLRVVGRAHIRMDSEFSERRSGGAFDTHQIAARVQGMRSGRDPLAPMTDVDDARRRRRVAGVRDAIVGRSYFRHLPAASDDGEVESVTR